MIRRRHEQRVKRTLHHQHAKKRASTDEPAPVADDDVTDGEGQDVRNERSDMDQVDHVLEMDGHIIGIRLSKDERYHSGGLPLHALNIPGR